MKHLYLLSLLLLAAGMIFGCGRTALVVHTPVPIEQKENYRREYTPGGKDAFYYKSYLLIVNASQYKLRIVQNGAELPTSYAPKSEIEIQVKNQVNKDAWYHIRVVAYGPQNQVIGMAEKMFMFNGTGQQQVEQWVLQDWMFEQ